MHQRNHRGVLRRGFTLLELLVSISIMAILLAVVSISTVSYLSSARDAERQSDLQNIKAAIEQYRIQNGRYPNASCGSNCWSTEATTNFIEGLSSVLSPIPNDPRPGTGNGYAYRTNWNGTVYKLMSRGSVENTVTADHPLQPCDTTFCTASCQNSSFFTRSYAVWGGFADDVRGSGSDTATVICAM